MTTTKITRYIIHYQTYGSTQEKTKTFRDIDTAKSYLSSLRDYYREVFKAKGYRDACGSITPEHLEEYLAAIFYVEKRVVSSERIAL